MSRECYLHEHQRIVRLYLSPRIYWKWTQLHRYLMRFFCNHFHQKEKHYYICESCFPAYDVMISSKNLVLNQLIIPELIFSLIFVICLFDIVMIWLVEIISWSLMGGRWLSKHSVHGKKSPLVKGDLIDRLTGQNNGFELGGTEIKFW